MNNTIFHFPKPENEPVKGYAPGSPERKEIRKALDELYNKVTEIPAIIGGKEVKTKNMGEIVMPTENHHVLARYHKVSEKEVKAAIAAAMKARQEWADTPWIDRASVMLKIATLISGKYRYLINAATMSSSTSSVTTPTTLRRSTATSPAPTKAPSTITFTVPSKDSYSPSLLSTSHPSLPTSA